MTNTADEIASLAVEIADLGEKVEGKRARVAGILVGNIALKRNGARFLIQSVRVYQGGSQFRLVAEGPALKKDGTPHQRNRETSPIELLATITAGDRHD